MSDLGQRLRRHWWHWTDHGCGFCFHMFLQALPLFVLWMLLPLLIFLLTTILRTNAETRRLSAHSYVRATPEASNLSSETPSLRVAYPERLFFDDPAEAALPLSVWLVDPAQTPASIPSPRYIVEFHSSDDLEFVDKEGNPAWSAVALTPAPFPITPTVLYIRSTLPSGAAVSSTEVLTAVLRDPLDGGNLASIPMHIGLETVRESGNRRKRDELLDARALIPGLVTALIGFGVQQWKTLSEEETRRREETQEAMKEIERMERLVRSDLSEGARLYLELRSQSARIWQLERTQDELEQAWERAAPKELRRAVQLLNPEMNEEESGR